MDFGKLLTAMVTPFDENNQVNFSKTTVLINHLIENGTEGLVVAGTTGESPTLSSEEKVQLFEHVVKVVDKRVPVIAGTGSNNTNASVELTKKAEEAGVDGVLLVTPYYNKPNQQGIIEHFTKIANNTNLPVMLYNIPGRTVVNMTVDTVVTLSKVTNIVSIKESSGDLDVVAQMIEKTSDDFSVYSGDDSLTLPMLSIGGNGVVSVSSHIIGIEMKEMIDAYETGDVRKAARIHRQLLPVMKGLFIAPSPSPVKTALRLKGLDVGNVRLPLVPLSEIEIEYLAGLLIK
ncbi:4-hydroxy-tetrahydrodipicolinate synthase [Aquibacillus koreensis]|uniref:4-hydroxy-tetrahydrodipicolinate synthase n=1 Tax=Aquibacillus koreensis TaxID=279446 RepID=A0A9X3WKK7_9BACI|nr:4-hydroxy-tetrahydrodipicolinate synthase [Aquibacillus koreensis]MCT2534579.1 4-hydroxy-tetrahydrodipicolinate synthase [Aquibacillus koreensis]MDC3421827.1 4-hydroxy-tetrahydrodipicolinate synthase [Aquibacillus koreensis]